MNFLLAGLAFVSAVTAFPNGAPICCFGNFCGIHRRWDCINTPCVQPITIGGYQTVLAGIPLMIVPTDPTFVNLFPFGEENELVIQSGNGTYLKGILVIAWGGDTENVDSLDTRTPQALTITDTIGTNESIGCENFAVSSVAHTEPSEKNSLAMSFKWPIEGQKLFLDVNIVKNYNVTNPPRTRSYYAQFAMQAVARTCKPLTSCGLLGLSILCPLTSCGLFGKMLGLCDTTGTCA